MKKLFSPAPYLCGESKEVWIPVPEGVDVALAMRRIKGHVYRLRQHATVQVYYACNMKGDGVRLVKCILDAPIEKKQRGRPKK